MIKQAFLFFSIIILSTSNGQEFPYRFSQEIEMKKNENQNAFKLQLAATDYALQGNYVEALKTWNEQRPLHNELKISTFDSIFLQNSTVISAKDYIINRSVNEEIIILNELHHNASHRVFASSLLKDLYANGYRYLGLEALDDAIINERRFPTLESGFYTSEPEFGNFIKEALNIGFIVFGYEATKGDQWDTDQWKNREIAQAQNINTFMQNHKAGKYFIYCGAGHAFEGDNNGRGYAMAGVLTQLTGINPFTIDQNRYADKGDPRYNQPLSKLINNTVPSVLVDTKGEAFRGNPTSYETDIAVIQPANYYTNNNFHYLENNERFEYSIPKEQVISYPALILVYRKGEEIKNGVPTGVIELKNENDSSKLFLKESDYDIKIIYPNP